MQNVDVQTPLLFGFLSLYHLVDSETEAGFAQDITTRLGLSRGCHSYTSVLSFLIKDNIARCK